LNFAQPLTAGKVYPGLGLVDLSLAPSFSFVAYSIPSSFFASILR
jgi:hypothetical protein